MRGGRRPLPRGTVVALDIIPFEPVPNAICLPEVDILTNECSTQLQAVLTTLDVAGESQTGNKGIDVVLSDMAPSATGNKDMDHDNVVKLCYAALTLGLHHLSVGGTFLCKLWNGWRTQGLYDDLRKLFKTVRYVKPPASRNDSAEIYLLAQDFVGVKGLGQARTTQTEQAITADANRDSR
ncbi:putative ribosomal RNA methyltransferase CG11447-like [Tropilaelaps mercedesae]|uniref:rRNA methyltransferase 2, mitochondrial n=1 Tax=Tropilaelaps mercedesae TaxID=418985 RepID=A0A1V9XNV4_9ACAR|nr:putative ribosomal RNA methyltransferase CG11447-like [Tropilaelaps mercedesae]